MYLSEEEQISILEKFLPVKNNEYLSRYLISNLSSSLIFDIIKILSAKDKVEKVQVGDYALVSYKALNLTESLSTFIDAGLAIDDKVICLVEKADTWKQSRLDYTTTIEVSVLGGEIFDIQETRIVNRLDTKKISVNEIIKNGKNIKKFAESISSELHAIVNGEDLP